MTTATSRKDRKVIETPEPKIAFKELESNKKHKTSKTSRTNRKASENKHKIQHLQG